jgi:hypothetical protein
MRERGFVVKRSIASFIVVLAALTLALPACRGREKAGAGGEDPTATIAPATPQPEATGTEAMTQTVDVEGGRSEAEGGGLTSPNPPVDTTTDGTPAAVTTANGGPGTATTPVAPSTTTR